MLAFAKEGRQWQGWIVDPDIDEKQRQMLEDIHLLSCRIDDCGVLDSIGAFREGVHAVTVESRDAEQLTTAMNNLSEKYDVTMELRSEAIKTCIKG